MSECASVLATACYASLIHSGMRSKFLPDLGDVARLVVLVVLFLIMAVGAAQIPGAIGDRVGSFLSSLNPFAEDAADRTGPPVLQSLTELREFKAASGYYEVIVDLQAPRNLPGFISDNRVIYVGKGDVEAVVDFSELDDRRITASDDRATVTVNLPAPTMSDPRLDLEASYVAFRDEGFVTRFRGSDLEREAQLKAVAKLTAAASGEARLIDLAKESTTAMLQGMFSQLGYTDITITFDESQAGGT